MGDPGMGRRIQTRRQQLGLSLRELARRAEIESSQLSKIERGISPEIRSGTLMRLAYHLGVTADWILGTYEPDAEEGSEFAAALA